MYIKGFRISEFRKGTAILISNLINDQTYITKKYQEGRYIKLKYKTKKEILKQRYQIYIQNLINKTHMKN